MDLNSPIFLKSKEEALPHVLEWLGQTYEERRGCMLLKKDVHVAYTNFCTENRFETTTNAAFGKIFKRVFPSAEVRRLVKHNETTFFYENMAAKSAGRKQSAGDVAAPSSSLFPASFDPHATFARQVVPTNGHALLPSGTPQTSASRSLQYKIKKMTLTSSPRALSPVPFTSGNKRASESSEAEDSQARLKSSRSSDNVRTMTDAGDNKGGSYGHDQPDFAGMQMRMEEASNRFHPNFPVQWRTETQLSASDTLYQFYQLYRTELWALWPINPIVLESLSYIFNTDEGANERSALSVGGHFVVSMGYLMLGDVTHAREFFGKAREHLSHVFDSSNYDVACMLKNMAWAATFFCGNAQEGYDKEIYYLAVCKNICQVIGAVNDPLYFAVLKRLAIRDQAQTYDSDMQVALSSPKYNVIWDDHSIAPELKHYNATQSYQVLERYKNILSLTEASRLGQGMYVQMLSQGLLRELYEISRCETYIHSIFEERPPPKILAIHMSYILMFKITVYNHLNNQEAVIQHVNGFIQHLATMEAALVAIVISEFSASRLFSRELINVMLFHRMTENVTALLQIMQPLRTHFFWVDCEFGWTERALRDVSTRSRVIRPASYPPSFSSSYPLPHFSPLSLEPHSLRNSTPPQVMPTTRSHSPTVGSFMRSLSQPPPYTGNTLPVPPEFRFGSPLIHDDASSSVPENSVHQDTASAEQNLE